MTIKLELKSSHEVIDTVNASDVDSIFHGKPTDPDILAVLMKDGKRLYCDEVCPIDSLQEEPVSIDFEQELYKAFGQVKDFTWGMRIAKWCYDMGKNSQEPVSDELEDAASRYAKEEYSRKNPATLPDRCICCYAPIMYAFRNGANWQKERMMKEAVKGGCFSYRNGYKHISCDIDEKLTDIKLGDKVKLVIIKED